jgi:hypothetical protein
MKRPRPGAETPMLRIIALALAMAAPGIAMAEPFPHSALHTRVVGDRGAVVGQVNAVERDAAGKIVAVEIDGLEPPSAPNAARDIIAEERQRARAILMNGENRQARAAARLRAAR